jgi:hypothetical protein
MRRGCPGLQGPGSQAARQADRFIQVVPAMDERHKGLAVGGVDVQQFTCAGAILPANQRRLIAFLELPGQGAGQQLATGPEPGRFADRGGPDGQQLSALGGAELGELGNCGSSCAFLLARHRQLDSLPKSSPRNLRFKPVAERDSEQMPNLGSQSFGELRRILLYGFEKKRAWRAGRGISQRISNRCSSPPCLATRSAM